MPRDGHESYVVPLPEGSPSGLWPEEMHAAYWAAVQSVTRGLIHVDEHGVGGPVRIQFGPYTLLDLGVPNVGTGTIRYPILGGLLAARGPAPLRLRGGGELVLRRSHDSVEIDVMDFSPALPDPVYKLQQFSHQLVSHRYTRFVERRVQRSRRAPADVPGWRGRRAVVLGATGTVGHRLCWRLAQTGADVVAVSRSGHVPYEQAAEHGVHAVGADLADLPDGLFAEGDVVYHLVHRMGDTESWETEDAAIAEAVGRAAARAGVERIVYLGAPRATRRSPSRHLRSRALVGDLLADSGVPTIIIGAPIVVAHDSASFGITMALARKLPVMITPKWVTSRSNPVYVWDAVEALARLPRAIPTGESFRSDIGGADVVTYRELIEACARALGSALAVLPVPALSPRLSSRWIGLFSSQPKPLVRALVEGMRSDSLALDQEAWLAIGLRPTPLEHAVDRAVLGLDRILAPTIEDYPEPTEATRPGIPVRR